MTSKINGVNLGGWFVLEQWMKPTLFEGLSGPDETIFSKETKSASIALKKHWDTFITKADLLFLKDQGINQVRLPIPWWFEGEAPYVASVQKLEEVFDWFDELQFEVLLDLHTAPGCQNGFDNGGITNQIGWHTDPKNIALTIEKLVKFVRRFHRRKSYFGIEVLNEPHVTVPLQTLQSFYRDSYRTIRNITPKAIVFHDGFRPEDPSWKTFFAPSMTNVYFDLHLYLCFNDGYRRLPLPALLQIPLTEWKALIEKIQAFVPVIVGEWSLGFNDDYVKTLSVIENLHFHRALASAQWLTFQSAFGSYFWSYRVDRESHLAWDLQRLLKQGIFPRFR